ncbi:uncharacterized protein LOC131231668 isoform X3 [Magnolia sinica]|uniref:uncharacterized protein LOC131231668 isoform X3 n=1 Tax=Magnolia sinica TaxID=86752 RepID=UPI0026584DCF|nr:uncharacterized protein LOC131231668 isoform X3 [Magnolia sinica]
MSKMKGRGIQKEPEYLGSLLRVDQWAVCIYCSWMNLCNQRIHVDWIGCYCSLCNSCKLVTMHQRKAEISRHSNAFIALPGTIIMADGKQG